jgi:hypothetical protein
MNILILATMAPLCGFYLYALVNFQREIRRSKRNETAGAKTIPLYWRDGQLSGADPARTSADASPVSEAVREARVEPAPLADQGQGLPVAHEPWQEICQVESVYLGPFLVIPVRNREEHGAQRRVTEITARRAG